MQTGAGQPQNRTPEVVPPNVIRVETALSRYPMHRLAKQGTIGIEIRERSESGDVLIQWRVSHNSEYGQPGPLAYKLDTLIVNRRIEEASHPTPRIIKLGSLKDICRELGLAENGKNTNNIKNSLSQNALAGITAKIRCKLSDGTEQKLEAVFTRYSVIFTGEQLPDGRTADAVYLELSDRFMQVINGAQTRPLDYDYLKELPPASQRLYELLSFQMYAVLKHARPRARLSYAEFCTHAPLTRHEEWLRVRTQMNKLHAHHKKSGYIQSVEFEQTTDRDGKPDWLMLYVPGPRARGEFRAFTKRGGSGVLEIEQPSLASQTQAEPTPLEQELIARGVTQSTATELVAEHAEERITAQVEQFDWLVEKHPKKVKESPAGFLVDAIKKGYAAPPGFETKAEKAKRDEAKRAEQRRNVEVARREQEARAAEQEQRALLDAYVSGLEPDALEQLDREALEQTDPDVRADYEQTTLAAIKRMKLRFVRESHVRRLLGLPKLAESRA